ncbi:UL36 very large tegument protein, partial [Streptomyces sp. NPDC059762]
MTVTHLPSEMAEFTLWLGGLAARAERTGGWWAVFAERDPDGLGACLDGTELLPWDVVESLLQDVGEAPHHGRELYAAAAAAHDRRPGGAEALTARRALMERERRHAETRVRELGEWIRTAGPEEAARLAHDLAWTRDDHARATARIVDLTDRLDRLHAAAPAPAAAAAPAPAAAAPAPERARGPAAPRPRGGGRGPPGGAAPPRSQPRPGGGGPAAR